MITAAEVDELVAALVEQTRAHLTKSLEGFGKRLEVLEDRVGILALAPGLPGPPGKDVDPVVVADLQSELAVLRARLEEGPSAAIATLASLAESVAAGVATKALAAVPIARDGLDGLNGKDGIDGKHGVDGKDGKDGIDGKHGVDGKDGKDGLALVDAVIDRAGHLILTTSDGRTKDVGEVVGAAGRDGRDVDPEAVDKRLGAMVAAVLETWPKPRDGLDGKAGLDGLNGKDGLDGLGFDDLEGAFDAGGRLSLRFRRGDKTVEIRVPCLTDQTVYKPGAVYHKGDGVTFDRSFWIAQVDKPKAGPTRTPNGQVKEWRLAVARGRDSKELITAELAALDARGKDGD